MHPGLDSEVGAPKVPFPCRQPAILPSQTFLPDAESNSETADATRQLLSATALEGAAPLFFSDLLVIELCCGSANLSWACHKAGFEVMPIDHKSPKHSKLRVLALDLTLPDVVSTLKTLISQESHRIVLLWVGLPCGTASRAREKPLPHLSKKGIHVPKPLRSPLQPHGLDSLMGVDKTKTELANQVYCACTQLVLTAIALDVRCVIENPMNSRYWSTTFFRSIQQTLPGKWVDFHACAHGGKRPKHTVLWVTDESLDSLRLYCPGTGPSHVHAPWTPKFNGKSVHYPTAEEAEYHPVLCERVAGLLRQIAVNSGALETPALQDDVRAMNSKAARLSLQIQPSGAKLHALVPEHGHYVQIIVMPNASFCRPQHASLVSRRLVKWGTFQAEKRSPRVGIKNLVEQNLVEDEKVEIFLFGFPLSPKAFVQKAVVTGHPYSFESALDPTLKKVVHENVVGDEVCLAKTRLKFLAKWLKRAKELETDEEKLHESFEPYIRNILKGKRLLLWQEMIDDLGLPDRDLIRDMQQGFRLSGWLPSSIAFPPKSRRPEFSISTLKILSEGLNNSTMDRLRVRQEEDLEKATWGETLAEESSQWIWKCDHWDVTGKAVAHRFGLRQNDKIRVIDDCTCCGLNSTVGLPEKFLLHSIDKMASMLAFALDIVDGSQVSLCGRTYDLKSAYKQFPVNKYDRDLLRLAVNVPHQPPALYGFNSLPFGAVGSVAAFLRISMCLWQIGVIWLRLVWTAFFDDYSVVCRTTQQKGTAHAIELLFSILGLSFARDGKKAPPFSCVFHMLGLNVDLSRFQEGSVQIGHTQKRVEELRSFLDDILAKNCLNEKTVERLRGRMNFFEGHCFGRGPSQALKVLRGQARYGASASCLSDAAKSCVKLLKERLNSAVPLQISKRSLKSWFLFTDGACGPDKFFGGVGAVLYNDEGFPVAAFSERVPDEILKRLLSCSQNPIYELELFPVLLALRKWENLFASSQVVCYLDNDAARHALVKSCAGTREAEAIIAGVREVENRVWYSRVPTLSNPADGPSRLKADDLLKVLCSNLSWELASTAV